jgi:hypothetical protein
VCVILVSQSRPKESRKKKRKIVPVSSMLKHVVTRLDGNLYSKKSESKTILSFHLWPSTSAPSPVSRLHPAQSPPTFFSAPVTAHAATHRHPSFPSPPSTRRRLPRRSTWRTPNYPSLPESVCPAGGSCGVEVIKRSAVREQTACAGAGQPRLVAAAAS